MKGGVGKTTTVVSLAETLATDPKTSVLVVDIDTQANASYCFTGDTLLRDLIHNDKTVDHFFERKLADNLPCRMGDLIKENVSKLSHAGHLLKISLMASSPSLRSAERRIIHELTSRRYSMNSIEGRSEELLKKETDELKNKHNYIIFDCAPGISAFATAAIAISDLIIVPTIPDFLSYLGLSAFIGNITNNMSNLPRKPVVLITRKRQTNQHRLYAGYIRTRANEPGSSFTVFDTEIPERTAFPEALEMIDEEGLTFLQKYDGLSDILFGLAAEVKDAFNEVNRK